MFVHLYLVYDQLPVVGVVEMKFLRPAIKYFGRFFHRKTYTKRPRNPSNFQECLDTAEEPRACWKPVLFAVFILPTVYYMFYSRAHSDPDAIDPFSESFVASEQQLDTDSGDIIIVHKKLEDVIPIKETLTTRPRKSLINLEPLPLCTVVTVNTAEKDNDTDRDRDAVPHTHTTKKPTKRGITKVPLTSLVQIGGHYAPTGCRPRHKVAILVPYSTNRKKNLDKFLHHIHPFLMRQRLEYRIFVIEQYGSYTFNKGRLLNAGFLEVQKNDDWQCVIFHDVDLLPTDDRIRYTCPVLPRHMCASVVGKENVLRYRTVFGGVVAMTMWQFKKANGYSNSYWGRGESEDMFKRLQASGLGVTRYKKDIGKYISLKHQYRIDNPNRIQLLISAAARYKDDGLSSLQYNVASYASFSLHTHIVVNINDVKKQPDYITDKSVTFSP